MLDPVSLLLHFPLKRAFNTTLSPVRITTPCGLRVFFSIVN